MNGCYNYVYFTHPEMLVLNDACNSLLPSETDHGFTVFNDG